MFWNIRKYKPKEISPSTKQEENRVADALFALRNTIADEAYANRRQESGENKSNTYISIATLVFVILTTTGIFYQALILHNTDVAAHDSATAAKDAATAASTSATVAQKTAETAAENVSVLINSERARLLTGSLQLIKNGETDPTPHIDYTWINFGRGAAIVTAVLIDCRVVGKTIPAFPLEDSPKVSRGLFTIGSGATGGTSGMAIPMAPCVFDNPITPDDWPALQQRDKYILYQGFLDYEDTFRRYRWHFGSLYYFALKGFSTNGLPEAYNHETQQEQAK
jgi:hypothetical protein